MKDDLKLQSMKLHIAVSDVDSHGINKCAHALRTWVLPVVTSEDTGTSLQDLQCAQVWEGSCLITVVAYRVLLTVPVTLAIGEKSFSAFKVRNWLRTTVAAETSSIQRRLKQRSVCSKEMDECGFRVGSAIVIRGSYVKIIVR